jgi:hypothetical protein
MKTAQQTLLVSAFAFLLAVSAATSAEAASTSHDAVLFQMAEVGHTQIAASEDANEDAAKSTAEHKNRFMNNKFTEHVCAAHVFHPKRKHAEAEARKKSEKKAE